MTLAPRLPRPISCSRAPIFGFPPTPSACADAITQARACLAEVANTCHRIVEGLHEPSFDAGIEKVFGEWIAAFGQRAGVRVDFNCAVEISSHHVATDVALALFRVMQEALGNVARHVRVARASVSLSAYAHGVTLTVEDDGVGISAIARRKAGRFGLSGMRACCEALGGSVRIAAAKNGGTSVRTRLPWPAAPHAARGQRLIRVSLNVLLADDHAIVRRGVTQLLVEFGPAARVAEAETGHDALALAARDAFDVAMLDISLPDMNGLDVLKRLKRISPRVPVLMFLMYREDQYAVRALKAGASGYLSKTADPELMIGAIRQVAAATNT